jgi:hypothetical protein
VDPELRSVILRYSVVGLVLAGAVIWAVTYTTAKTGVAKENGAPILLDEQKGESARQRETVTPEAKTASPELAPSISSLLVEKNGARRVACEPACRLEAYCGLRSVEQCLKTSCDGDVRKLSNSDFTFAQAEDCAAAAEAPCEEACWRRGECTGDHVDDKRCTASCKALVKQRPAETFVESRCILESACADLAACAEVTR